MKSLDWLILDYTVGLLRCLPFTQTTWVEILCRKIDLLNLKWWVNDPLQSKSKSAEQTEKGGKINLLYRLKSQPIILKPPKKILFSPRRFAPRWHGFAANSLRSRRLKVVGTRKNGRARRRHARGKEAPARKVPENRFPPPL